ncbi:MAG: hypothetical protein K9I94_04815 [Bacteroidales bacterium]|nr:hypothetical protein [Bacteroidales bacterium]
MKKLFILFVLAIVFQFISSHGQEVKIYDDFLKVDAGAGAPLYTTYTAAMERSRLYADKGYKMHYDRPDEPLSFSSDQSGRLYTIWEVNDVVVENTEDYHKQPVVKASFPDMAVIDYEIWKGVKVHQTFLVYSSSMALVSMKISNLSDMKHIIELYPVYELGNDSLEVKGFNKKHNAYITHHFESRKRLISNLYAGAPYPADVRDIFALDEKPYSYGAYKGNRENFYNIIKTDYYSDDRSDSLNMQSTGLYDFVALHSRMTLATGESKTIRFSRGWQSRERDITPVLNDITTLSQVDLQPFVDKNIELFASIPRIDFTNPEDKLVYLSAFNLARGCMLPPTGQTGHNFYVFSREPKWGWGHGHQVLHESLSMLAYAYLDRESAQGSQRVYMEQQGDDGLIAYRHGPRGTQAYPHKGEPTTSAPFYSWINWEVYEVSKDKGFLKDAYASGTNYVNWLYENRDDDKDGTFEWGPYGLIENVRDWYNVIFQVSEERHLDIDKEDISNELECLDLSLMVVNELHHLAYMADELGKDKEKQNWNAKAQNIIKLINERMWDEETQFFYHVDKKNHTFRFMERDLKRPEIIGFLPLWANAISEERAAILIDKLTDTATFWRKYGVPTLSATDPWYSPYVDYCCKWNGPVWLLWDYMVFKGLKNYGYDKVAEELAGKMMLAVKTQLSKNHNFWESYSADNEVLNCPSNYIWDAIMAKVLIERERLGLGDWETERLRD